MTRLTKSPPADAAPAPIVAFADRAAAAAPARDGQGRVTLVGAGPGDPDLLTLRAVQALRRADVVIYDGLVDLQILDHVRPGAHRVLAGKRAGRPGRSQLEINAMMVHHARLGRDVVRLKGGDPMIFGRAGEELAYLRGHSIAVDVVPGVTAATGCAAAAGFSLTHRDASHAVTFLTGQECCQTSALDWRALATLDQTMVVYMGVGSAATVAVRLIEHGMSAEKPIAIIENGTRPNSRTLRGQLCDLASLIADHGIRSPALLVIGDVTTSVNTSIEAIATHGHFSIGSQS